MEIKIIAVGKLKEDFLKEGVNNYSKEINKKYKLTIIELVDEKTSENASEKEEIIVKDKEGEGILQKISPEDYVICMDLAGKLVNTADFRNILTKGLNNSRANVVFVIGGSLGISQNVLKRTNERVCFSKMTYPHQLFRLMLLEQISNNI